MEAPGVSDQTAPAPGGLSDQEFERFAALSSKKVLSDAEMEEVSGLDTRLHGAATSGSQRQPAATSGTEAPPVITRHRAEPLDENGKPYWLQLDALGGEGATVKNDSGGRIAKSVDDAIKEFGSSGARLKSAVNNGDLASAPGATLDYLLKAGGVPFAGIAQGAKEWLGDPLHEAPQGKNGRMSGRQVMAATLRAPLDLPNEGGMALAQVPGVRQFADATLGSSQPGAPKGHEVLGGALGAVLGAEVFGGRAPGSSALGLAESGLGRIRAIPEALANRRIAALDRAAGPTDAAALAARAPEPVVEMVPGKGQPVPQPALLADAREPSPFTRQMQAIPPNDVSRPISLGERPNPYTAVSPETTGQAPRQFPELDPRAQIRAQPNPYTAVDPGAEAPAIEAPNRGRFDVPDRAPAPAPEGMFPAVDQEMAARKAAEFPAPSKGLFQEAQDVRRFGRRGESGQALAPSMNDLGNRIGRINTTIPEATPGTIRSVIEHSTNEKIGNLKRYSPDLFNKVKLANDLKERGTAASLYDMNKAFSKATTEDLHGLTTEMMERRAPTDTPAQKAIVDWWHRTHPEIKKAVIESGSRVVEERKLADLPETIPSDWNLKQIGQDKYLVTRPIGTIEDFFPMRMSEAAREALKAGGPEADAIREAIGKKNPKMTPEEINQQLETYKAPELKGLNPGVERPRKIILPDELREPDVPKTIRDYLHKAHETIAEQRAFNYFDKATGEARNPDATWSPQGDLGDILGKIRQEGGRGAEEGARRLALDVLGRDPATWDPNHQASIKGSNTLGAVNALRLYGLRPTTALIQLTQNSMTHALVGEGPVAKAIGRVTTDFKGSYEDAIRAGAVDSPTHYAETVGLREGEAQPSRVGKALQKTTNVAMMPMAATDLTSRLVAWETRFDFATKLEQQLNGNAWQQGIAKTNLAALDYSPADIQKFKSGMLTGEDMDILGKRIVERTQGRVTNASRIPAASGPLGRLMMQGKNFGVAQTRNTWRIAGKQLIEAKNPVPAMRLLVSTYLVGKGIMSARDMLTGEDEKHRPHNVAQTLKEGGLGGMAGDVANAVYQSKGKSVNDAVNNLTHVQAAGLAEELASLGINVAFPPKARVEGTGVNVAKPRSVVLKNAIQRAVPTEKEWQKIIERALKAMD